DSDALMVALPLEKPGEVARMNALPTLTVDVTLTVTLVEFSGTVTLPGTVTIVVSLLTSLTGTPPAPAGLPNVTVSVPVELMAMFNGFGVRVILFNPAVMVTV